MNRSRVSKRQPKQMSTLLEASYEEDSGDEEMISRHCIYCKPDLYLPREALADEEEEDDFDSLQSIEDAEDVDYQVEELRDHCK